MATCLCAPADYHRCDDESCANARTHAGADIVHAADCNLAEGLSDVCSCGAEDPENWRHCEQCGAGLWVDDLCNHGDIDLCPKCSAEFTESVMACHHFFDRRPIWNEYGEEGLSCRHCGAFVDHDLAMNWFPMICDGWVEIEGADA